MKPHQVHVDPDKLREFANELGHFATIVAEHDGQLRNSLLQLGETFRDEEYDRFRDHFESSRLLLNRLVEEAKKNVLKLNADADLITESQQTKLEI